MEEHAQTSSIQRVIEEIEGLAGAAQANGDAGATALFLLSIDCLEAAIRLLNPPSPSPLA